MSAVLFYLDLRNREFLSSTTPSIKSCTGCITCELHWITLTGFLISQDPPANTPFRERWGKIKQSYAAGPIGTTGSYAQSSVIQKNMQRSAAGRQLLLAT